MQLVTDLLIQLQWLFRRRKVGRVARNAAIAWEEAAEDAGGSL